MGALGPVSPWTPGDDVLLRDSIEIMILTRACLIMLRRESEFELRNMLMLSEWKTVALGDCDSVGYDNLCGFNHPVIAANRGTGNISEGKRENIHGYGRRVGSLVCYYYAGASLESLAKGAVQFSRKFTVREIQDRWYSLLYDPVVSAEAAFHMTEFEHSTPTLPSKYSRAGNSKENKYFQGRGKLKVFVSCYYALRKRICSEPFNSMDLSFLVGPNNSNYVGNEYEQLSGQCTLGDPVTNHFVHQESNLDIMHHAFPEIMDSDPAHAFDTQFQNTFQEDYPMEQDNIHETHSLYTWRESV
ncbi:hypothetical protein NC652_014839 [Populus alba x Populus x berolinensis]|nr:hypothetical protein NC652_014839 [Populus alba x Populus x berolinensis]